MSNYSEDNTFNMEREQTLRDHNLYFAENKLKNLTQRREQRVPTPEPRRRLAGATNSTKDHQSFSSMMVKHSEIGRLEGEIATDEESQTARLVTVKNHESRYLLRDERTLSSLQDRDIDDPRVISHKLETSGYDRLTSATQHVSPTGTPADEGVGSPATNTGFDEDDDDDDDDDEDHIRLADGDDDELVDEYYEEPDYSNQTKLTIGHEGPLTNLSRQSMVPIHELIAYYQYIQDPSTTQPYSLDRATNTTTTTSSSSATTSRQSSSASQQTTRTRHSDDDTVDTTDAGVSSVEANSALLKPLVRKKRSTKVDKHDEHDNVEQRGDCDELQLSDCHEPKIFIERVSSSDGDVDDIDQQQQQQSASASKPCELTKVQDRSRLRANVVLELINSERDFVKHLKNVVEGYLHRARKHPEIFTAQQINTIFANIEQLYEFQRTFLEDLEKYIDWTDLAKSQVGHCFLRYEKGFSVYHYYCNNHPNATSELQDLYSKSIFRSFFEECRLKQNMIDISLDGFLLTPIQKICKYPLQLTELLKNTAESHPDYPDVSSALESMRNCANLANERKRRIEALADVMSFQEKIDNWFGPKLSSTSSILIHSGEVSKMSSHTWSQGLQLHLFDHLLLYFKRDLLKRNNLILKGRICMDTVTEISDADEYKPHKSFKLFCGEQQKWFVFTTKSEREKDEWIRAFERERNLVESDENEGFHITDRELGIARRALLHRKRSRSARYRHQHNSSKRPDTAVVNDQLELDDSNLMINRTLSLPSCIHPSHVMNFVEDSRVVSNSNAATNSSTRKKNSSPSSNSRSSPMASSQHLPGAGSSELPDQVVASHQSGPTNWLRKMGSKKLTRAQVYQINGQTGQQPAAGAFITSSSKAHSAASHVGGAATKQPPTMATFKVAAQSGADHSPGGHCGGSGGVDVDATALKYDELEKRHRDHMVSEQQARLYRLNNDLPPPPTLYPQRSLTPTPLSSVASLPSASASSQGLINVSSGGGRTSDRPKSSPSQQHLHDASFSPPNPSISASSSSASNSGRSSQAQQSAINYWPLEDQFKESLSLGRRQAGNEQHQRQSSSSSQTTGATFETELVLSSGRVVHVREDAV